MSQSMKAFLKAMAIRAIRTFCQTAVATIGTTALLSEVNWLMVLSTATLSALLCVLNSIATGLPEAELPKLSGKPTTQGDNPEAPSDDHTGETP